MPRSNGYCFLTAMIRQGGCAVLLFVLSLANTLANDLSTARYLTFVLDDSEKQELDIYSRLRSDRRFTLSIEIDGHPQLIPAVAHIRGQGTRSCERKSFSLDLPKDFRHSLLAGSDTRRFHLLSMCQDRRYLRTFTIFNLWKELGFLPLDFRFIELRFNGDSRGIYMLLEKPVDGLLRQNPDLSAVLRRTFFRPMDTARVRYTDSTSNIAMTDYVRAFLDLDYLRPEDQINALEAVLDLDQFMQHLAVSSVMRNGDYIDELWIYQTASGAADSPDSSRYKVMKWDPDDVLHNCHHQSRYAWEDQWEIAYCAEAALEKLVLSNPLLYPKFVSMVEQLAHGTLSTKRFSKALDNTLNTLLPLLDRDDLVAPMEQFYEKDHEDDIAVSPRLAQQMILESADFLKKEFRLHHHALLLRLEKYHQAQRNARLPKGSAQ